MVDMKTSKTYTLYMKKSKKLKRSYTFNAIFHPDEKSGGFWVSVPSLPGCFTQGETFEEASKNIKEAVELYLEVIQDDGEEIPTQDVGSIVIPVVAIV